MWPQVRPICVFFSISKQQGTPERFATSGWWASKLVVEQHGSSASVHEQNIRFKRVFKIDWHLFLVISLNLKWKTNLFHSVQNAFFQRKVCAFLSESTARLQGKWPFYAIHQNGKSFCLWLNFFAPDDCAIRLFASGVRGRCTASSHAQVLLRVGCFLIADSTSSEYVFHSLAKLARTRTQATLISRWLIWSLPWLFSWWFELWSFLLFLWQMQKMTGDWDPIRKLQRASKSDTTAQSKLAFDCKCFSNALFEFGMQHTIGLQLTLARFARQCSTNIFANKKQANCWSTSKATEGAVLARKKTPDPMHNVCHSRGRNEIWKCALHKETWCMSTALIWSSGMLSHWAWIFYQKVMSKTCAQCSRLSTFDNWLINKPLLSLSFDPPRGEPSFCCLPVTW